MASTAMLSFRPVVARSGTNSSPGADDHARRTSSPNWWGPLFGFSSEPDYINPTDKMSSKPAPDGGDESKPSKTRFVRGSFTEEKARQLRRMTYDTSSFHDSMYHSAIASRLASDIPDPTDA
ncbi:hypothetical protein CASFOL_030866 [Castilleja foliolosa]|uniref:Uncharacterized protein n=1 Tax=Castilleja foliolosa TaxID=1961234 RepID=A0ABD3C9J7_9LAMI